MIEHVLPSDIELSSMGIITRELDAMGIAIPEENAAVVKRVIHATADFEFACSLRFTGDAVKRGMAALAAGADIVTDTNMACAGISKASLEKFGGIAHCFMAEPEIAEAAKRNGSTRAVAAVEHSAQYYPNAVIAVGNAPTALLRLAELIEDGLRPPLVIAVPVGFVNVVESKERILEVCTRRSVPAIAAMGRKGGSTVCAAICNALLYSAADTLDPKARGWQ